MEIRRCGDRAALRRIEAAPSDDPAGLRATDRLRTVSSPRVVAIAAPTGYGKTTLLAQNQGVVHGESGWATPAASEASGSRGSPWAIMLLAAVLSVMGAAAVMTSGTLRHPQAFAALTAWDALLFVGAGLCWRACRPRARLGTLLIVCGFGFCVVPLQVIPVGPLPAIGALVEHLQMLALTSVVLLFPSGRLDRLGRVVVAASIGVIALYLSWILFTDTVGGTTPLGRCAGACSGNALQLAHHPQLSEVIHASSTLLRLVWAAAFLLTLGLRMATASAPRRRATAVVYGSTIVWLVCFAGYTAAVGVSSASDGIADIFGWGATLSRIALPLGFLFAPAYAQAFAGGALQRIVARVDGTTSLADIEVLAAETLDDPHIKLAFSVQAADYVDADGESLELIDPGEGRRWSSVRLGGGPVVAIDHDEALDEEPELIQAVGSAVLLVLEKRTIQRELTSSSQRIVTARQAERRRMERDLHDSAQQRLIALKMHVDLARGQVQDPGLSRSLGDVGDELNEALTELRTIAHGVYPPVLARDGLSGALTDAASHFGGFVSLDVAGIGRHSADVEKGVYFCIMEAIQNAAKHAGQGATVRVSIRVVTPGRLRFEVADNGNGFDSSLIEPGFGFASMAERVSALDGSFELVSAPGNGTTVSGAVSTGAGASSPPSARRPTPG